MRQHAPDPRDYEMMVVVTPTVSEEGLPAVVERISGYVATQGGEVASAIHENPWGRRRLAYQIQDHRDAFYVLYRFTAAPDALLEIEREMKLDEQVIRYLVVRYDELTEHEERPPRVAPGDAPGPQGGTFRRSPAPSPSGPPAAEADAIEPPATSAEPDAATTERDTDASIDTADSGSDDAAEDTEA